MTLSKFCKENSEYIKKLLLDDTSYAEIIKTLNLDVNQKTFENTVRGLLNKDKNFVTELKTIRSNRVYSIKNLPVIDKIKKLMLENHKYEDIISSLNLNMDLPSFRKRVIKFLKKDTDFCQNLVKSRDQKAEKNANLRKERSSARSKQRHPKTNSCLLCGSAISKRQTWCSDCKGPYKLYKKRCSFVFDLTKYPQLFDLDRISRLGFYTPNNPSKEINMEGLSRDHAYSVYDGFINNRDPKILAHPINCSIILHRDNLKKSNTSSITWETLLRNIEKFNLQ